MNTNEKMNAWARGIASDLGVTPADAAALLVHVLRHDSAEILAAAKSTVKR